MNAERGFVSALVLAAGRGERMGRLKQTLTLGGRPVLAHIVDAALASSVDEVVVVLGYEAGAVRAALGDTADMARVVVNPDYARGQATSLIAGLDAIDRRAVAAVVLLGDQPGVTSEDIDAVVKAYLAGAASAVRAAYESGEVGHPTVIGRALWDEIRAERGDVGAREVLRRHAESVATVALGKPAPLDLDTPADYDAAVAAAERRR